MVRKQPKEPKHGYLTLPDGRRYPRHFAGPFGWLLDKLILNGARLEAEGARQQRAEVGTQVAEILARQRHAAQVNARMAAQLPSPERARQLVEAERWAVLRDFASLRPPTPPGPSQRDIWLRMQQEDIAAGLFEELPPEHPGPGAAPHRPTEPR